MVVRSAGGQSGEFVKCSTVKSASAIWGIRSLGSHSSGISLQYQKDLNLRLGCGNQLLLLGLGPEKGPGSYEKPEEETFSLREPKGVERHQRKTLAL